MSTFKDDTTYEWRLEFDADLIGEVRDITKVDFTDRGGAGFLLIENDEVALVNALKVLCREQIDSIKTLTPKEFGKRIKKEVLANARKALEVAAADFFPASVWSAIQSRLTTLKEEKERWLPMAAQMTLLDDQSLPESMRIVMASMVQAGMQEGMAGVTAKANSTSSVPTADQSASGQDVNLSNCASDLPEKSGATRSE